MLFIKGFLVGVIFVTCLLILWKQARRRPFSSKSSSSVSENTITSFDAVNRNYICMGLDPIHTMNDLRQGEWNMDKVRESLATGMLRYARESEIAEARKIGRIAD